MVPGQPVDEHRRNFVIERDLLNVHLLIGAQHPVGIDYPFRHAGGPGGEEVFRRRIGIDGGERGIHGARRRGSPELVDLRGVSPRGSIRAIEDFGAAKIHGVQNLFEHPAAGHVDQSRLHQLVDQLHLGEVPAHQRIGRGHRRDGNADLHGRQRQKSVIDGIARQQHHRPLRTQAAIEQSLGHAVADRPGLGVCHLPPAAGGIALGQICLAGPLPGPAAEHVAPLTLIGPQRVAIGQQDAPIGERFHADGRFCHIYSANWRDGHGRIYLAAILSEPSRRIVSPFR